MVASIETFAGPKMKLGSVLVFAFLFTLLVFTYGVEGGKNKDTKERDRRRKERREKRREKEKRIDNNPAIFPDPTLPVPTRNVVEDAEVFGDPVLEATKRPHRHQHKSRGKDRREKAKKHKKDRERRREKGTGEVTEPEIVSFDDMTMIGGDDPTDPAPAPAPTSKEEKMTEEFPADNEIVDNITSTNMVPTTMPLEESVDLSTTEQISEEPTQSPTPQVTTESGRRRDRGREGKKDKDKKKKDRSKNKDKKKQHTTTEADEIEIEPTEFEFSPTMQPEPHTTVVAAEPSRRGDRGDRGDRRRDRGERRKDKKDKKKNRDQQSDEPQTPTDELVNDVVPTSDSQTQTEKLVTRKSHSKKNKDNRNRERESNIERRPLVETIAEKKEKVKPNRDGGSKRRDRNQKKNDKKNDRLREPVDASSSMIDECKSDRDCSQGSCCEVHEGSKICRNYNHQEGQKCRDHCACHSDMICQAPEPTRRSQRNKRLGPSRCRIPGINGMGNDFVGLVQDALEDVMDAMDDRNN